MNSALAGAASAQTTNGQLHASLTRVFTDLLRAFLECSNEVQAAILEMARIVNDPETDSEDKELALATIQEALFPQHCDGELGADVSELAGIDEQAAGKLSVDVAALDAEEAEFAARVQALMDAHGMSQVDLANASGVGQPAISMMLSRNCRPQKRTVLRIAAALGVSAGELWSA